MELGDFHSRLAKTLLLAKQTQNASTFLSFFSLFLFEIIFQSSLLHCLHEDIYWNGGNLAETQRLCHYRKWKLLPWNILPRWEVCPMRTPSLILYLSFRLMSVHQCNICVVSRRQHSSYNMLLFLS